MKLKKYIYKYLPKQWNLQNVAHVKPLQRLTKEGNKNQQRQKHYTFLKDNVEEI